MPYGYTLQQATAALGGATTNGTTNTETDHVFVKPGNTRVLVNGLRLQGRGNALTTLNGLSANFKNFTTASTAGTARTPAPVGIGAALASLASAATLPTVGTGGLLYKGGFGCSGSGSSFWTAPTPDQAIELAGAYAGSIDLMSVAIPVSLAFDWWLDFLE